MKIYSWNVNGIRAVLKKGYFQRFLAEHNPDVLCLQETKAQEDQVDINVSEYETYWNSAVKKGYSGTAIFTKIPPVSVLYGLPADITTQYSLTDAYGDTTTEGRVVTIELESLYIVTVYTPNAKDDLSRIPMRQAWDPAFRSYVKQLELQKPVVFCGDLNVAHTDIDLARPKENKGKKGFTTEEREGISALCSDGFLDTYRLLQPQGVQYTWWSHFGNARARNIGWRIDYVFISETLKPLLKNARIHDGVVGSDHCPVSIELTTL